MFIVSLFTLDRVDVRLIAMPLVQLGGMQCRYKILQQDQSCVPLQFLVDAFYSSMVYMTTPVFVNPTRPEGSCVAVPFNATFMEQIVAATSNPSIR